MQLLYPPLCLVCQNPVEQKYNRINLCPACAEELHPVSPEFIRQDILERLQPCFLDSLLVCFEFNSPLQTLIHQIKYGKFERLGQHLARLAAEKVTASELFPGVQMVLPVPLYPARQKERGFNQSCSIARGFFTSRKNLLSNRALVRSRPTRSQTELDREDRRENVHDAFRVLKPQNIDGKEIVLVDDVVTTGATLNECARVLKKNGAARVAGLTLATPVS